MRINKSVFLIGAGASAASDFSLPTMAALIEDSSFSRHKRLSEFAAKYFPNKKPSEIDIEELITYLDFVDSRYSIFGDTPDPDIWHVKSELFFYLRERLTDQSGKEYCEKFKRLFSGHAQNNCRNSIITLNYDLVIDKTLASLGQRRVENGSLAHESLMGRMYRLIQETVFMGGTPFSIKSDPAYYLKLHGSLDWYYCSNLECKNHLIFFANRLEPWPQLTENDICQLCGSRAEPVIVPPNINKSFSRFPKLAFIWNLAYREIQAADALVIIGLSFRNTDYYLRWLVKSSLFNVGRSDRTFELIDTSEKPRGVFADLIGIKPDDIRYFKSLPEYIDMVEKERREGRRA